MAKVVLKLGDDISTDVIYPGRFMATVLPAETPQYAFADMPEFNKALNGKLVPPGSVIVAGKNFGCGSSREQAVSALKGHELIIVAESFARIFLQNAINLGLGLVSVPGITAQEGDELEFHPTAVLNKSRGTSLLVQHLPQARQAIIDAGGLIPYTRNRLMEKSKPTAH